MLPPPGTLKENGRILPGCRLQGGDLVAIQLYRDIGRAARARAVVEDAQDHLLLFVDDAEARRLDDFDAAIEFVGLAGDQAMDRRVEAERLIGARNIMDFTVGQHDGAADTGGRDIADPRPGRAVRR